MATNPGGDHESARDREDDDTSVRALPSLDEKLMHIDLAAALEQLRHEAGFESSGRNAMTIVKYRDLRIVLELMRPGARIDDPRPETGGAVVVQVLSGRLRLEAEGQTIDLSAGRLVALDHIVPSQLTALEESAFLIWVSWAERAAREGAGSAPS
ncbi:MAG: hypothetical protein U1E86_27760 [Burkholderiaceae bacterium]